MDLNFWIVIFVLFALQWPFWGMIYLLERHMWNKGVSRKTGEAWIYTRSTEFHCLHKFEAGEHKATFSFRFDK